jgi:hypothetical protein
MHRDINAIEITVAARRVNSASTGGARPNLPPSDTRTGSVKAATRSSTERADGAAARSDIFMGGVCNEYRKE